ncbi:MAG: DUF1194 domain-containing protein [Pseudomonadota bacterium]
MKWLAALAVLLALTTAAHAAEEKTVDLELVLLADATGSIDDAEIRFQREGYAQAITSPEVLAAITGGLHGKIAVTYVEWGDFTSQQIVVPWTILQGADDAQRVAKVLTDTPRLAYGSNAIGAALVKGMQLLETNEIRGLRRVIDLSADSANNWNGPPIREVRDVVTSKGITINGLAILCRDIDCGGRPVTYNLEEAFRRDIIGGPGAFVVTAGDRNSFAKAVKRKLILEIAGTAQKSFARTAR